MRSRALVLALTTAVYAWDCSTPLSLNGNAFELTKLSGTHEWESSTSTPPTVTKSRYQLSLCSALPDPSQSAPEDDCPSGTRLCLRTFSSRSGLEDRLLCVVPVAADAEPQVKQLDGVDAKEGWVLELGGGTYGGQEQRARIEMRCDAKASETTPTVKDYDPKSGLLDLKWVTSAACPSSSASDPPPSSEPDKDKQPDQPPANEGKLKESSGMGFFGWFFTLLFLGLAAYFALGIYSNYSQYGATGWDAVPHRDVLRDLPYVVSDLFKGRGASRNGYSSLG